MDLNLFGNKLKRYREQFQLSFGDASSATGIDEARLRAFENGEVSPSGDEVLILADYYKCDYKFFISNEKLAPFEQTETLFRIHGKDLSKEDRWAIQEFLFLCECEEFLQGVVIRGPKAPFRFAPNGTFFKGHGAQGAAALRKHLGYAPNAICSDVFDDLRRIGIHVFRRQLANSNISGLFILHPVAGKCVLVNYDEDIYRQRFTAAHEGAHAIFDTIDQVVVSFQTTSHGDFKEVRANTFASNYLLPPSLLKTLPAPQSWDNEKGIEYAAKLKVSTSALAVALKESGLIDDRAYNAITGGRVAREDKVDPELPKSLSPRGRKRKTELLTRGLSDYYVDLCFDAYAQHQITSGRLAEILLLSGPSELHELATLYGRSLQYGD